MKYFNIKRYKFSTFVKKASIIKYNILKFLKALDITRYKFNRLYKYLDIRRFKKYTFRTLNFKTFFKNYKYLPIYIFVFSVFVWCVRPIGHHRLSLIRKPVRNVSTNSVFDPTVFSNVRGMSNFKN